MHYFVNFVHFNAFNPFRTYYIILSISSIRSTAIQTQAPIDTNTSGDRYKYKQKYKIQKWAIYENFPILCARLILRKGCSFKMRLKVVTIRSIGKICPAHPKFGYLLLFPFPYHVIVA